MQGVITMSKDMISAKQIMERYNLTYNTVNHYTNFGLLSVVAKKGKERLYNELEVNERLARINELVREGYSLHLIRKTLMGI